MSVFSRFRPQRPRQFRLMFALAMVPVVGAVGAAIDYSRVVQVRSELADALDAGVLAVGSRAKLTDPKPSPSSKVGRHPHGATPTPPGRSNR